MGGQGRQDVTYIGCCKGQQLHFGEALALEDAQRRKYHHGSHRCQRVHLQCRELGYRVGLRYRVLNRV